jgi:predicted amidophosphoribosyltransferase
MAQAGADLLTDGTLLCPVPIHWSRRIRRKYNQSAELCRALAARTGVAVDTDILRRRRSTTSQEGLTAEERAENQAGSMFLAPRAGLSVSDAEIVIVDDVMASGATLSVATDVLIASGAKRVSCLLLARGVKAP